MIEALGWARFIVLLIMIGASLVSAEMLITYRAADTLNKNVGGELEKLRRVGQIQSKEIDQIQDILTKVEEARKADNQRLEVIASDVGWLKYQVDSLDERLSRYAP